MESEGVSPNAVTYNTAIRACGAAGALFEALSLMDEMERRRIKFTVVTFGSAVSACQLKGDWQLVRLRLSSLEQVAPPAVMFPKNTETCCG